MNKLILVFHVFILVFVSVPLMANDKLDQLLKERKVLYADFEYYRSQKSSFWGTQSKKDLKKAVDVLKKIILKDTEIIKQINIEHTKKSVQVITKTQVTQDFSQELEYDNNRLKLLLDKTTFDYNKMLEETAELKSDNNLAYTFLFFLVVTVLALAFYIQKLRERLRMERIEREESNIINIDSSHRRKVSGEGQMAAGS